MECHLLFILLLPIPFIFLFLKHKPNQTKPKPPGPRPWPIIGHIHLLGPKPHESITKLARIYGPIMSLKLGNITTIVISSSEIAKELFSKHDLAFSSRHVLHASTATNHDKLSMVWLPVCPKWRYLRKIAAIQVFTNQQLDASQVLRRRKVDELIDFVTRCSQQGQVIDIGEAAFITTLNLLSNTFFSMDLCGYGLAESRDFKDITWEMMEVLGRPNVSDFFPLLSMLDLQGLKRRIKGCFIKTLRIFGNIIDQRLRDPMACKKDVLNTLLKLVDQNELSFDEVKHMLVEFGKPNVSDFFPMLKWLDLQGIKKKCLVYYARMLRVFEDIVDQRLRDCSDSTTDDVLGHLLHFVREKELALDDVKHMLLDLFAGGIDTTATTLEWVMTELLRHPDKMAKAQKELNQVIGKGGLVQESNIAELPYIQAIVKETLRLHPATAFLLPHKTIEDVHLLNYDIPKDAQVWVNVWSMGRDPSIWPNSESFLPERFLGKYIDMKGQHFELIPFGAGRRMCPGLPLAYRMVHLMLANLLHSFNWKLADGINPKEVDMEERFGITLEKNQPLRAVPLPK